MIIASHHLKTCSICNLSKAPNDFIKNNQRTDGHSSWCKECNRIRFKKYYEANKAGYRKRNKERRAQSQKKKIQDRPPNYIFDSITGLLCIKQCSSCEKYQPIEQFSWQSKGYYCPYCKECDARKNRDIILRKTFGLSIEQYNSILEIQEWKCPICNVPYENSPKSFAVDHDHASGKVRGILCGLCNPGIGYFKDNPSHLRMAAKYLERVCQKQV